jgi:thymidylate kinase
MKQQISGKIIAIVGAPRSGKSYLADLLGKYYGSKVFLEGEEADLPRRIIEDIEKNKRPLERILWFRNALVEKYIKAIEHKKQGELVILDTFWFSTQLYIDALTQGFERELAREVAEIDNKTLMWPDLTVFLNISEKGIRKFVEIGGRSFDTSENFIKNQAVPINTLHQEYFEKNSNFPGKVLIINRDLMDFAKKDDFQKLVALIEEKIL